MEIKTRPNAFVLERALLLRECRADGEDIAAHLMTDACEIDLEQLRQVRAALGRILRNVQRVEANLRAETPGMIAGDQPDTRDREDDQYALVRARGETIVHEIVARLNEQPV